MVFRKSLLRYPGGKNRAVKYLLPLFPQDIKEVCSPFIGGGSVELALACNKVQIYGYDLFEPLVVFWQQLLDNKEKLTEVVERYQKEMTKEKFYELQDSLSSLCEHCEPDNEIQMASIFYALNRSSFSGTVLSGGYSPEHTRFNENSVMRLKDFQIGNFTVECSSYQDSIRKHPDTFLYCDPPYLLKNSNLYGIKGSTHKGFDHQELASLLKKRKRWILSYNNCPEILDLYKGYKILHPDWKYGMSKNKNSKEIIVLSS